MKSLPEKFPRKPCAACEAPMVWARTKGGRRIPLDPEPTERGNVTVSVDLFGDLLADVGAPGPGKYVSHFATCPKAASFRKER